jgi:hypothetical protein
LANLPQIAQIEVCVIGISPLPYDCGFHGFYSA